MKINQPRVWLNDIELGLGMWQGVYEGIERQWLRWYDASGNWVLTPAERERKQGDRERRRAERLAPQLRALGVEPDFGDDEEGYTKNGSQPYCRNR